MKFLKAILLLGLPLLLFSGKGMLDEPPLFLALEINPGASYKSVQVGEYTGEGLIEPIPIRLLTQDDQAQFYTSNIRTTVCDDEVCEIMHIELFWDLVGDYIGYDTIPGHPLTKFDHEPFLPEDYVKLHELLSNEGSILKFKMKEELIDKEKVKASDVVDGTTGATSLEIKEEVVEGALYTSYTIWHLAYKGDIKNMLSAHTASIFNQGLKEKFLSSNRSGYELFALKRFSDGDFSAHKDFILRSMKEGIPLLRKFILKDLPETMWEEEDVQGQICGLFSTLDVNSRTFLLEKLKDTKKIHGNSLESLSGEITQMNKNQLITFLKVLNGQSELSPTILSNIMAASSDNQFRYAHLIDEHAEDMMQH